MQTLSEPCNREQKFFLFQKTRLAFEVITYVAVPVPTILWVILGQDKETVDALLSSVALMEDIAKKNRQFQDPHCIEWIRERGPYYAEVRNHFISVVIGFLVSVSFSILIAIILSIQR